ncbi:hypothetical protein JST97_26625 [bacterium]|nr:hypothetical protein [bacterium]
MKRRGLSLAELVFSFGLVLLIVVLIFELFPMALVSLRSSAQRSQALAVADSLLAQAMQQPFQKLTPGLENLPPVTVGSTMFQPSREVLRVQQPGIDPERILALRITVVWLNRGQSHRLVRETWRTNVQR